MVRASPAAGLSRRQPFISDFFNRTPNPGQGPNHPRPSPLKGAKKTNPEFKLAAGNAHESGPKLLRTSPRQPTPTANQGPPPGTLKAHEGHMVGVSPLPTSSLSVEAQAKRSNQREVLKQYPLSTMVWAKFSKYPPWPALVSADPISQMTYDNEEDWLHVLFLDDPPTRAWVPLEGVEIMKLSSLSEESSGKKPRGRWAQALIRAKKRAIQVLKQGLPQRRKFLLTLEKNIMNGSKDSEDSAPDVHEIAEGDEERENQSPKVNRKRKKNASKRDMKGKRLKRDPSPVNSLEETTTPSHGEENGLSEYELIRLKNIEARQKMFAELEIGQLKKSLSDSFSQIKSYNASQRGLAAKKDKAEDLPRRQSLRLKKIDADTGLQLPDKEPTTYVLPDEHPRQALAPLGLSDLLTEAGEEGSKLTTSRRFLESLEETLRKPVTNNNSSFGTDFKDTSAALSKLQIKPEQVAKVVPDRIFSLDIHPTEDKLLVAVGGKWGGLGLWDVKDVDSASNGVHLFMPHSRPVNCLSFDTFQCNRLISTSYDGTVRALDVQQQRVNLLYGDENDSVYTCYHRQIDAHTFVVALGNSGDAAIIDTRKDNREFSSRFSVARSGSVKTVDIHPCLPEKLLTTTSRGDCQIFDIRSTKTSTHGVLPTWLDLTGHTKALSSAFFSPVKGSSIVTVSYDNKLRLYKSWGSSASISPYSSIDHNNQTGRWLSTFKARWHPRRDDLFFVGCMSHPRQINAYSDQGFQYPSLMGEDLGSICSIVVSHPSQDIVVGGNSSGRVHVFM